MTLSPDALKNINDVNQLREICATLMRIKEKETNSKNKAREIAQNLQAALQSKELELKCLNEKVTTLNAVVREISDAQDAQKKANNSNDSQADKQKIEQLTAQLNEANILYENEKLKVFELCDEKMKLEEQISLLQQGNSGDSSSIIADLQEKLNQKEIENQKIISLGKSKITDLMTQLQSMTAERDSLKEQISNNLQPNIENSVNTTEYQEKIASLQSQLEVFKATNEKELTALKTKINELTTERDSLKSQLTSTKDDDKAKLSEYQSTIASIQSQFEQQKLNYETEINTLKQNSDNQTKLLQELKIKFDDIQKKLTDSASVNKQNAELISKLKFDLQSATNEKATLEQTISSIKSNNESSKDDFLKIMNKQKEDAQAQINVLNDQILSLKSENEKYSEHINAKQEEVKDKDAKIEEFSNKLNEINLKFENSTKIINEKENSINTLAEQIQTLKSQIDSTNSSIKEKDSKISELSQQITEMQQSNAENTKLVENLKTQNQNSDETVTNQNNKIKELEQQVSILTDEKKKLMAITEANNAKAKDRIHQIKNQLRENIEQHNAEVREIAEERQKFTEEIESLKLKVKKQSEEAVNLKKTVTSDAVEIQALNKTIAELRVELDNFRTVNKANEELNEEIRNARLEITTKTQDLSNEILQSERLTQVINDKDTTINKLKETIQMFTKTDLEKNSIIEQLRTENCELTAKIASLSVSSPQNQSDLISKLEMDKSELEAKLASNQASQELVNKNRQLSAMIEKLNRLYTLLVEENNGLNKELEKLRPTRRLKTLESFVNVSVKPYQKIEKKDSKSDEKDVTMAYLRRTLLQFFTEENSSRSSMVPLILDLVGCSKEQITVATREYDRSQQLITRTTRFFFK